MKYTAPFLFTFFIFNLGFGQGLNYVFTKKIDNQIHLKWYSPDLIYPNGCNVYRKETHTQTWVKINFEPVRPQRPSDDSELQFFYDIAASENNSEGLVLLNILVKSIQSRAFSEFLGIYFIDSTANMQSSYDYRVTFLNDSSEEIISSTSYEKSPEHLKIEKDTIFLDQGKLFLDWKFDESRFYAVNIYELINYKELLLNKNPLMIAKEQDEYGRWVFPKIKFKYDQIEENKEYRFTIKGLDYFGEETYFSDTLIYFVNDLTPPIPPYDFQADVDSMEVNLNWKSGEPGSIFTIERSQKSDGPFQKISTCQCLTFKEKLTIPGPYYYQIAAVDSAGNTSYSKLRFLDVQDTNPPSQPIGLSAKADTGYIELSWHANNESDLAGYYVYRSIKQSGVKMLLNSDPIDTNYYKQYLPKEIKSHFTYRVVAVDTSYNTSTPSLNVSVQLPDILPPVRPNLISVEVQNVGRLVNWKGNKDDDLFQYTIWRKPQNDRAYTQVGVVGKEKTSFLDSKIDLNTNYNYRITAVDSSGNSSMPSMSILSRKKIDRNPNQLLQSIRLRVQYKKRKEIISLSWKSWNQKDLLGFVLYSGDKNSRLFPESGLITKTEYSLKKTSTKNFIQLRAFAKYGLIGESNIVDVTKLIKD